MEQLADMGRSDPASRGLKDYTTFRERADVSVRCTGRILFLTVSAQCYCVRYQHDVAMDV